MSAIAFEADGGPTSQVIPTGWPNYNKVTAFDSVKLDTAGGWDNTNKKYVVQQAGIYIFYGVTHFFFNSTSGGHATAICKNGNPNNMTFGQSAANASGVDSYVFCVLNCQVGDEITLSCCQDSGQNATIQWINIFGGFCVGT